jgi:hypothetical protein
MFIRNFLFFLEEYYPEVKHDFVVTDIGGSGDATKVEERFHKKHNIVNISTFKPGDIPVLHKILKNSDSYDNIIFHSLYLNYLILSLLFNKKAIRRATVIFWGIQDVGPFTVPDTMRKYRLFGWFYEKLRSIIIPDFKYIGAVLESDYEKLKSLYNVKGAYKECKYMLGSIEQIKSGKKKNPEYVNIQLGHSGFPLNLTLEALDVLSKHKNENIRIYCPLSYGDEVYTDRVIKKGKEIFGRKFIPLMRQMTGENYARLISSMDIYVHNAIGQIGLGNVITNLLYGNKVYLNENGVVYPDHKDVKGFRVSKVGDISDQSFKDFVYISAEDCEVNIVSAKRELNSENEKRLWDDLLFVTM